MRGAFRRRVLMSVGLAAVLLASPFHMSAGVAGGDLEIIASATYRVHADDSLLEVSIDYTLTNNKPSTTSGGVITSYYYDRHSLVIPEDAIDLRASSGSGVLTVTDEMRELTDGTEGRVASILIPRLFYRQSRSFNFSYSVAGGAPRTDTTARVNPAYAAFWVTAFGDAELSQVEVHLPLGFEVGVFGDEMAQREEDDMIIFFEDDIEDPIGWASFITARRDDALDSTVVDLGEVTVDVLAWPGDEEWAFRVTDVITRGLPVLHELVGLEFGDVDSLEFVEALDPSLVGYAGWYIVGEDTIEMGEKLDDHVILHELSHLWFNQSLFTDRWINEGLADTFANQALVAIGGQSDSDHRMTYLPVPALTHAVQLNDWDLPSSSILGDERAQLREEYGYNTSFFVVRSLYRDIGAEGLSRVMNAARNDLIAYQDGDEPETVGSTDGWRRFLDLLEELGRSTEADALFRKYVVPARDLSRLDEREGAREAYRGHVERADGWATPWVIRDAMAEWEFDRALRFIETAGTILDSREAVANLSSELGLVPPISLQLAYETAQDRAGIDGALDLGNRQSDALDAVAEARAMVDSPRGFFTRIGLLGQDPERAWGEAAHLFEVGDLEGATVESRETLDLIDGAERVGQMRVLWTSAGLFGVVLLILGGRLLFIRIRHRPAPSPTDRMSGEDDEQNDNENQSSDSDIHGYSPSE